jgi:uncharacterized membrane protein YkoI
MKTALKFALCAALPVAMLTTVFAAETKLKVSDLPAAVQKTVTEQTKSATLIGVSKEVEKGKTLYEIETKANGLGRDLLVDKTGAIVEVEQEVAIDSIPAAARTAIQKKAAGGKITKVETLTQGTSVSYEAEVVKGGKTSEIGVNADGSPHKD